MRILISNDDGIYGSGMIPLIKALRPLGELLVIVPEGEKSASSHAITLHKPFRFRRVPVMLGPDDFFPVIITNGTPADCVRFGVLQLLKGKKVDLVVGGINQGYNLGDDTVYSGTVAIPREAAMLSLPAFAISVAHGTKHNFEEAAKVALDVAKLIRKNGLPPRIFLNVNVPGLKDYSKAKVEVTRLGRRIYGKGITARTDPRGEAYYWLAGPIPRGVPEAGTDIKALKAGKVSVTPLRITGTEVPLIPVLSRWRFQKDGRGQKRQRGL